MLNSPATTASLYLARGWVPVPIQQGSKSGLKKGWHLQRPTEDDLPELFPWGSNIGVLLGSASGWLVDVDIDDKVALKVAAQILPTSRAVFGRQSKQASHYLYRSEGARLKKFSDDSTGKCIVELRGETSKGSGAQSVFPGSIHPSQELVRWEEGLDGDPGNVAADTLLEAVKTLAAVTLLAKYWPDPGTRHDTALALAGGLRKAQVPFNRALQICQWVYDALDEDGKAFEAEFRNVLDSTYTAAASDQQVGWARLGERLKTDSGARVAKQVAKLLSPTENPEESQSPKEGHRATIWWDPDIFALSHKIEPMISGHADLYVSGGVLHTALRSPDTGKVSVLDRCDVASLRLVVTSKVTFVRPNQEGEPVRMLVPDALLSSYLRLGSWPHAREVSAIARWPFLGPDDMPVLTEGYHAAAKRILASSLPCAPTIPGSPTRGEAKAALEKLRAPYEEYPWCPGSIDVAVAILLTVVARPRIEGAVPAFLIDANTRGAGKTLVADVVNTVLCGYPAPRDILPGSETEIGKTLVALAIDRRPLILFDNVDRPFGGPTLDGLITAGDQFSGRILGKSATISIPWVSTIVATGNNLATRGDTARRVIRARIMAPENPERRAFKRPNLLGWVKEHRVELIGAALTLLRGYAVAGRPLSNNDERPALGSFVSWQAIVSDAIVWAGGSDVTQANADTGADDENQEEIDRLIEAWGSAFGEREIEPLEIAALASERFRPLTDPLYNIWSLLRDYAHDKVVGAPSVRSIGYFLRKYRDRPRNGKYLTRRASGGKNLWVLKGITKE